MNDLKTQEKDLLRQLGQAQKEYRYSARAAASGDTAADQASIRQRITTLEGELADVRAAIQGAEELESEHANNAARNHRVRLLTSAAKSIERRNALASKLAEGIDALGKLYGEFTRAAHDAKENVLRADHSKRAFEAVDHALGMRQSSDQLLAGLFEMAGMGSVMKESGATWASYIKNGPSFADITLQRTTRAATAVRHQIEQENSSAETPLSSRRSA